ncbi:hypothetical protein [Bifidobacterium leontopitheci]|uniref:Uncharacterized protein n=1 Tax=Bifidobacterium leontopitheci TaxID=2650774 RepID=A0A6I1GF67_9BIFI|nr:hypothetical protein [Bifidobacterium leontopitheci]KAB7790280.1 hypothetical protein F7D09_1176 [Bifidobacterium leontopitheci]
MLTFLDANPATVTTTMQARRLAAHIADERRVRAVLVVSTRNGAPEPDIIPESIVQQVEGRIDVVVIADDRLAETMAEELDALGYGMHPVYNGAARLFMPRDPSRDGTPLYYTDTNSHRQRLVADLRRRFSLGSQPASGTGPATQSSTTQSSTTQSGTTQSVTTHAGNANGSGAGVHGDGTDNPLHLRDPHTGSPISGSPQEVENLRRSYRPLFVRTPQQARDLAGLLLSDTRDKPVVVVSKSPTQDKPFVDVNLIAGLVHNRAVVAQIDTKEAADTLKKLIAKPAWVYGDAGRVFPVGSAWNSETAKLRLFLPNVHVSRMLLTNMMIVEVLAQCFGQPSPQSQAESGRETGR